MNSLFGSKSSGGFKTSTPHNVKSQAASHPSKSVHPSKEIIDLTEEGSSSLNCSNDIISDSSKSIISDSDSESTQVVGVLKTPQTTVNKTLGMRLGKPSFAKPTMTQTSITKHLVNLDKPSGQYMSKPSTFSTATTNPNVKPVLSPKAKVHEQKVLIPARSVELPFPPRTLPSVVPLVSKPVGVLQSTAGNNTPRRERARLAERILFLNEKIRQLTKTLQSASLESLPDKGYRLQQQLSSFKKELSDTHKKYKVINEKASALAPSTQANTISSQSSSQDAFSKLPVAQPYRRPGTFVVAESLTNDALHHLHTAIDSCPVDSGASDAGPQGLKVPLLPHQQKAMAWLLWRESKHPKGGILADDMGLGKTLTMIALILRSRELREHNRENLDSSFRDDHLPKGGTLVICPASVLCQWEAEIKSRCERKKLSTFIYHGKERSNSINTLTSKDVVLTTYNLVAREGNAPAGNMALDGLQSVASQGKLFSIHWERVILDEAHQIRNPKTQGAKGVCLLQATYRWALTGTPIHNKLLDLYSLIRFLKFTPFNNEQVWRRCAENKSALGMERLNMIMKSIMLRRTKEELQKEGQLKCLPDKEVNTIEVQLDEDENAIYQHLLKKSKTLMAKFMMQRAEKLVETGEDPFAIEKAMKELQQQGLNVRGSQRSFDNGERVQASHILLQLLRLRQICCHTSLVKSKIDEEVVANDGIEDRDEFLELATSMRRLDLSDNDDEDDEEEKEKGLLDPSNPVFQEDRISSKIAAVLETVLKIKSMGEKVVLVSQWTSMLDIVDYHLRRNGIRSAVFTGKLDTHKRQEILQAFNQEQGGPKVLLLSLTAGGTGVNLIGGNHLVLMDIHWNPQLEAQAMDRVYRVGQKRDVKIYRFICSHTVEQSIQMIQEKKLQIAAGILNSKNKTKLDFEDLKSLFLSI